MTESRFIADRVRTIGSSGIRRVFDLGATLKDPINLSIGQPDFDVPDNVKEAMIRAVRDGHNGYTVTRGLPALRERIGKRLVEEFDWHADVLVTSGVSGGLLLGMMACLNPGDEVVFGDPYFVSYPYLARLAGGVARPVPLYDDFQLCPDRIAAAITPKTKMILLCSPGNPTGVVHRDEDVRAVAELAREHDLLLVSDEIYAMLSYDGRPPSVVRHAPERTVLLRGYGKSYGMTGWRMGYAAGPEAIIAEMAKLQQYTFVCAPQPCQYGALEAMDTDMSGYLNNYRAKRDLVCNELEGALRFVKPSGGFYVFPEAPARFASATAFVEEAIRRNLLIIPGEVFSQRDTHFRISYAAPEEKLRAGCEILRSLAESPAIAQPP
jgi:aspartate aminotransferase/aminotransferase